MHSLPLYHSAQMHVFLLPYLAVGATNTILERTGRAEILDLVEAAGRTASSRRRPSGSPWPPPGLRRPAT